MVSTVLLALPKPCIPTGAQNSGMKDLLSGKKKSTEINFLGPETTRQGGGLPRGGGVAEKFVPSLESLSVEL